MNAPSPQVHAADPALDVFVTANAGSGKTSTLVDRVARLLLRGARPEAVLCVTYTKAAAAEMQRRLFERLGGWSVLDDARLGDELAHIGEDRRDLSRARTLFARALETPGGLKIQTLHAFCEALLRRFPLEAGVSPGFAVLEDAARSEVSARAREELAELALADPGGRVGAAYAHLAVELDGRAFETLLTGFEGGRETVQAYARACLERGVTLEDDVWDRAGFPGAPRHPEELEHAAATACDWARWRSAAAALALTGKSSDAALGARLTRLAECAATSPAGFSDCWAVFSTKEGEPAKRLGTQAVDAETLAWLGREQARLHDTCRTATAARQARDTVHVLTLAVAHAELYEGAKHAAGALDFSDLISRAADLLTRRSEAAWVLYKLDGGIDHVLLDEAQDTSPDQWSILRALTGEFFAGAGVRGEGAKARRTVFVVGDEKQSIYSFQGAAPERLLEETRAYQALAQGAGRELDVVPLLESWRSTPQVLAFVDAVFADPATRSAVAPPVGEEVVRHVVGGPRRDHAGCVDLWPLFQDQPVEEPDAWDAPLDTPAPDSARKRLARRIAQAIGDMIDRGEAVYDRNRKDWRPIHAGDVLILVRRRDALFEEILRALKTAGVPVAGADRLKLSSHVVFEDVRALMRFCLFPWDDLTLAALLRSPFCDVDEGGLYALAHARDEKSNLWAELSRRGDERPEWLAARVFLGWARAEARERGPFDWLGRVLGRLDAAGRPMRQRILTRLGPEAEDALEELLAEALAAEGRGVADLERFAAELERTEVEVKRELEGAGAQVRVMTVHGAKGLEAPVVILPDTTGRPPAPAPALLATDDGGLVFAPRGAADTPESAAARQRIKDRQAEEGLRLLYVALTRARDRVIVCGRLSARDKGPAADSWYARVEAAFARPGVDARTVAEGELLVRRYGPDPRPQLKLQSPPVAEPPLPAWLTAPGPAEPATSAFANPSAYAERGRGPAPSPLAAAGGLGRFRRGELIHRLLQLLPDVEAGGRADAAARLLERERDLTPEQRREMAGAALGVLGDARFAAVFGPGGRAEAAVAGGAPDLPPGLFVSGRIDRMVVTPERVLVVDFKTNRPAPDRIEAADPAYLVQMALYVAVLRAVFPDRRVEAALVWTDGPKLMPVPENVVAQELARVRRGG